MSAALTPPPQRIAVLRANALGDFLVALPALAALRARYPAARISLFGKAWLRDFLQGQPGPVDEVLVVPDAVLAMPAAHPGFFAPLRTRRFDVAVQLHGGGRTSNPFVRALGAGLTAGWRAVDAPALDRNLAYDPTQPVVLHLLEAVALVGAVTTLFPAGAGHATAAAHPAHLVLTPADHAAAARLLPADPRPLVVLQPGSTDARRCWPVEHFAALGDALTARGLRVAVHGAPSERARVNAILGGMRTPAHALCGDFSLRALAALLARSALLIGSDSGPVHLARAVGTPTVAILWIGNLRPWGPWSAAQDRVAVSWQTHCPVCGAENTHTRCAHDPSFVAAVPVAEVRALASELLDAREQLIDRAKHLGRGGNGGGFEPAVPGAPDTL